MSRLTYRTDNGEYTGMLNSIEIRTALEKLSKLEDIEEELGIDLIPLLTTLTKNELKSRKKEDNKMALSEDLWNLEDMKNIICIELKSCQYKSIDLYRRKNKVASINLDRYINSQNWGIIVNKRHNNLIFRYNFVEIEFDDFKKIELNQEKEYEL